MSVLQKAIELAAVIFVLYGVTLILRPRGNKPTAPLPPGPKRLPLVGNIADMPPKGAREWEHWLKHKEIYGPISSVTLLGTTLIILNDAKIALELMERRGGIHSSRPDMVFSMQMCGWKHATSSQPYGDRLRSYRQRFHRFFGTQASLARYGPVQEAEVGRFLLRILRQPEGLRDHLRTEAGAIILKMAYGYTVDPDREDPLVTQADLAIEQFSAASMPGDWLVDTIPMLRHLPDWMPGTGFKRTAREWGQTVMEAVERPMSFVKMQMEANTNAPSYVADQYKKAGGKFSAEEEHVTKWSAVSLYTAGADTSVSTLETFFLAMMIHPEIQRKAREEIDRVVGTQRLPTFEDRKSLPYVGAIVDEALRWHPVAPLGLPHVPSQDDIFEGYLIPKDSMIMANIWHFTHDPEVYKDPMTFNPERFLVESPPPDPRRYVFGFGRRICPGRLLANSSIWLTIAKSLATLDIQKPVVNGKVVEPVVLFEPGLISHPYPFEASIKPRSPQHEHLIRAVELEHPWEKSSAKSMQGVWN